MKKMKKTFCLLLAAAMLIGLLPTFASAAVVAKGSCAESGVMRWQLTDDGVLTITGSGPSSRMKSYNGDSSAPWRKYSDQIKEVKLILVGSIGYSAFCNCKQLTDVSFGSSLSIIEDDAFAGCTSLKRLVIPDGVVASTWCLFYGCSSLESVKFGEGTKEIQRYAFSGCKKLGSVSFPKSLTKIHDYSPFEFCYALTDVYYAGTASDKSKIKIDIDTYYSDDYLANATWHYNAIDGGYCSSSRSHKWMLGTDYTLTISGNGNMPDYSDYAPAPWSNYKDQIKKVRFEGGVTSVGAYAFADCTELTSIWSQTIKAIQSMAFYNCQKLDLAWWKNVTTVGDYAFAKCNAITTMTMADVTSFGVGTFAYCESLTDFTTGDDLQTIPDAMFGGCSALKTVYLGSDVAQIRASAFYECNALTTIDFGGSQEQWDAVDKVNASNDPLFKATVLCRAGACGANGDPVTWHLDSNGVLTISGWGEMDDFTYYFSGPSRAGYWTNAPWDDFYDRIKSVVIKNGVTSIGGSAFWNTPNLESITVPNSVKSAGSKAMMDSNKWWKAQPEGLVYLGNVVIGYKGTIPEDGKVQFKDGTVAIAGGAFKGRQDVKELRSFPDGITTFGESAFENSNMGGILYLPDENVVVKENAFAGTNIIGVSGSGVTQIGEFAFKDCKKLVRLTIKNENLKMIGSGAFMNCEQLAVIYLGKNLQYVDSYAFSDCPKIKDVYFSGKPSEAAVIDFTTGNEALKNATWHYTLEAVSADRITLSQDSFVYNGEVQQPTVTVKNADGKTLVQGRDYTVSFGGSCKEIGTYTVLIAGQGDYENEAQKTYTITEHNPHTWDAGKVTKAATCKETGVKTYTCTYCKMTKTDIIPKDANNHKWDAGKVTKAATCAETGTKLFTCTLCSATKTEAIAKTTNHTWDAGKVTKAATCAATGVKTFTCSVCKGTKTETIAKTTDHKWDAGKVTKAATCAATGVKTYTCTVCKTTKTETIAKTTNHTWDAGKVTKAATCAATGVKTYTCSVCKGTKTETIAKTTDHKWDAGKVTKAATCAATGVKTYTCSVCKTTKTETIAKTTDHKWDAGKVTKAATCAATGEKTFTCTVCKTTKTETIAKTTDHKWDAGKVTKEATAAAEGVKTYTCTVCGVTKTESIPKQTPADQDTFLLGDADGNGKVESSDARLALRASVHLSNEPTDIMEGTVGFKAADYDQNGKVESSDARCILRASVKLDPFG